MVDSYLSIDNLTVSYRLGKYSVRALDNLTLEVPGKGYTLGIVGESGSGKTTLGLSIMNMIDPPAILESGMIEYLNRNILKLDKSELRKYRWQEVAMVYQSAMNSLNPVKPICHPIIEVIREHSDVSKSEAEETALKLLTEVGIERNRAYDYPFQLSGGMRQRVTIALALALKPKMLIADEPTSALDVVVQKQILKLLKQEVITRGLTLLLITHEIAILPGIVENVVVMHRGEIVEKGPIDKVLHDPLHPYTERLLDSLLTLDKHEDISEATFGDDELISSETAMSMVGCKYSNRCKYAFDRCRKEAPILKEVENGRLVSCHKY